MLLLLFGCENFSGSSINSPLERILGVLSLHWAWLRVAAELLNFFFDSRVTSSFLSVDKFVCEWRVKGNGCSYPSCLIFPVIIKDLRQFIQSFPFAFRFECIQMICLFTFKRTDQRGRYPGTVGRTTQIILLFQISLRLNVGHFRVAFASNANFLVLVHAKWQSHYLRVV